MVLFSLFFWIFYTNLIKNEKLVLIVFKHTLNSFISPLKNYSKLTAFYKIPHNQRKLTLSLNINRSPS